MQSPGLIGGTVERYRHESLLGVGGFGVDGSLDPGWQCCC